MGVRFLMRFFLVFLFVLLSLQRGSAAQPGDLISMTSLGRYSVGALEILNDEFYQSSAVGYLIQDQPDAGVRYAVDVYRVEYYATDFNGALVIGSGLYADPVTSRRENVVLYTHGTSVTVWDTPSNVSGEAFDGPTVLINVAGRGGLKLLMPDGTGFWTSTVPQHRYLMGEVEGRTAIDMWTAVQQSGVLLEMVKGDWRLRTPADSRVTSPEEQTRRLIRVSLEIMQEPGQIGCLLPKYADGTLPGLPW